MVAGPDTILKITPRPDDAEALTVKGVSTVVLPAIVPKVMVWLALVIVIVKSALAGL